MPGVAYTGGNTTDYLLGRGIVSFDGDAPSQYLKGFRDLGNCPEFTVTLEGETKEHQSFLSGLKTIDRSLLISQKMSIKFTLEEINTNNMSMFFLADHKGGDASGAPVPNMAAIASDTAVVIDAAQFNVYLQNIALYFWYDLQLVISATAVAALEVAMPGHGYTGATFKAYDLEAGQVVTGVDVVKNPTSRSNNAGGTPLQERTAANPGGDYELDRKLGRIRFFPLGPGTVTHTNSISIRWNAPAVSKGAIALTDSALARVQTLAKSGVIGAVVFCSENAATGHKMEMRFHQVTLQPDGDFAGISDEVAQMSFSGVCAAVTVSPFGGSKYADIVTRSGYST